MSCRIAAELVAGVVRELRFVERALLAEEPALAAKHLDTAIELVGAARRSIEPVPLDAFPEYARHAQVYGHPYIATAYGDACRLCGRAPWPG